MSAPDDIHFFACKHVREGSRPARMVTHDPAAPEDDTYPFESWVVSCGQDELPQDGVVLDGPCFWALIDELAPAARALGPGRALVRYDPGHRWQERSSDSTEDLVPDPALAA